MINYHISEWLAYYMKVCAPINSKTWTRNGNMIRNSDIHNHITWKKNLSISALQMHTWKETLSRRRKIVVIPSILRVLIVFMISWTFQLLILSNSMTSSVARRHCFRQFIAISWCTCGHVALELIHCFHRDEQFTLRLCSNFTI